MQEDNQHDKQRDFQHEALPQMQDEEAESMRPKRTVYVNAKTLLYGAIYFLLGLSLLFYVTAVAQKVKADAVLIFLVLSSLLFYVTAIFIYASFSFKKPREMRTRKSR